MSCELSLCSATVADILLPRKLFVYREILNEARQYVIAKWSMKFAIVNSRFRQAGQQLLRLRLFLNKIVDYILKKRSLSIR
jgi:hypothetical protein